MKILLTSAVLALSIHFTFAQSKSTTPVAPDGQVEPNYIILAFHGANPSTDTKINHDTAVTSVSKYAEKIAPGSIVRQFNLTGLGATMFQAKLSPDDAESIRRELGVVVSLRDPIEPTPIDTPVAPEQIVDPKDVDLSVLAVQYWTTAAIIDYDQSHGTFVNARRPVLYLVDSGLEPFVASSASSSGYVWHPQFQPAVTAGKMRLLQGAVPTTLAYWPPDNSVPEVPAEWLKAPGTLLELSPTTPVPCIPLSGSWLDPYKDNHPEKHGTKVTSVALGATIGVTGRFPNVGYDVQSIRIYDNTPESDYPAHVDDAIAGISLAIDAHIARRVEGQPEPASVLLFTSRSPSATINEALEVALYRAWLNNIFCVVAGGNYITTISPNSFWYPLPTSSLPSSPSRFDWVTAAADPNALVKWPWAATLPVPEDPYLLIVGGNNATEGTPGSGGWANFSKGPDIDLIAPALNVPCAIPSPGPAGSTPPFPPNTCLVQGSGTSLSAGYVAGVALAYMACKTGDVTPTPADVRNWFLPPTGYGTTAPCDASTVTPASGSHFPPAPTAPTPPTHYLKVPKLKIKTTTYWQ